MLALVHKCCVKYISSDIIDVALCDVCVVCDMIDVHCVVRAGGTNLYQHPTEEEQYIF